MPTSVRLGKNTYVRTRQEPLNQSYITDYLLHNQSDFVVFASSGNRTPDVENLRTRYQASYLLDLVDAKLQYVEHLKNLVVPARIVFRIAGYIAPGKEPRGISYNNVKSLV